MTRARPPNSDSPRKGPVDAHDDDGKPEKRGTRGVGEWRASRDPLGGRSSRNGVPGLVEVTRRLNRNIHALRRLEHHDELERDKALQGDAPKLARHLRPRCGAKCRTGLPCRAAVVWDVALGVSRGRCRVHGGASTGPRTSAGRERCAAAARKAMLERWARWRRGEGPCPRG